MKNKLEKNDSFLQDSNKHSIINFSIYYFVKNNKKKSSDNFLYVIYSLKYFQ